MAKKPVAKKKAAKPMAKKMCQSIPAPQRIWGKFRGGLMSTYTREVTFQNDPAEEPRVYPIERSFEDDCYERDRNCLIPQAEAHANRECGVVAPKEIYRHSIHDQVRLREEWRVKWGKVFLSKMTELCRERGI